MINSESLEEPFTFDKRDQYLPMIKGVKTEGNRISYSFPAHSFTQIKVEVRK